jgi:CPA1 family monovalent cation:H+ antiporter
VLWVLDRVQHVPTAIILQFVSTFGVWILAEQIGLSAVLTMVCYAVTVARTAPARVPARTRIPSYAVWETAVFSLTILAFIFIGLQIRPIFESLEATDRGRYLAVAGAVLVTVIVVRLAWHMAFNAVVRWRDRRFGFHPPRPMLRPTVGSGLIISWSGMRGIVSLAAAMALPCARPSRSSTERLVCSGSRGLDLFVTPQHVAELRPMPVVDPWAGTCSRRHAFRLSSSGRFWVYCQARSNSLITVSRLRDRP